MEENQKQDIIMIQLIAKSVEQVMADKAGEAMQCLKPYCKRLARKNDYYCKKHRRQLNTLLKK